MTSFPTVLILLILSSTTGTAKAQQTDPTPTPDAYGANACVICHRERGGRLAEMVDLEWAKSVHFENNVGCEDCHGGDPSLTRYQFASDEEFKEASHATFNAEYMFLLKRSEVGVDPTPNESDFYPCKECHAWTTEKRLENPHGGAEDMSCLFKRYGGVAMSRERGVSYMCATCHPKTTEKQLASPHGSRGAPYCLFCHGGNGHAIPPATPDIIDTRPREQLGRCSFCHEPGNMSAVAHVRETLEETYERIKTSTEQFAELQRFGYRSLALEEMHAHIDDIRKSLRQVQHGCNLREINELSKSVENIAKRVAYDHDLVRALREARRRQTRIALGVAGLLMVLVGMLLFYRRALGTRITAWTISTPFRRNLTPPCNHACPAGNDIQGFIAAVLKEDYDLALETLLATNPLPSVCGRVCPAPCQDACNRQVFDESINIPDLERFVGDHGRSRAATKPTRNERIAVVGSGPAGLSATHHLARLGYRVTLFERDDELGGVLRTGIPTYRLPRDVLDREIDRILQHDVTVRTGRIVKREDLLRISHEFSGVFVATGLQDLAAVDLGTAARDAALQGIRFLEQARKGEMNLKGKRVVVVGGGNVAIDVARTALRLSGAAVRLYCLETREAMPSHDEETEQAVTEGVKINNGWGLSAILGDQGQARRVEFRRCTAVFDEHGSFDPSFDKDDTITVDADLIILATGRSADLSILPEGSEIREGEVLLGLTGASVFAGGDFAVSEGTVAGGLAAVGLASAAIGSGRRAALRIHKMLTGEELFPPASGPLATADKITMQAFSPAPRECGDTLAPDSRRTGFEEVHRGLSGIGEHARVAGSTRAVAEADRCFSCGVCNQCDRCVTACPEGIVMPDGDVGNRRAGYRVEFDYCQGCGTCARECPRGVIQMVESPTGAGAAPDGTVF